MKDSREYLNVGRRQENELSAVRELVVYYENGGAALDPLRYHKLREAKVKLAALEAHCVPKQNSST